MLALVAVAVVVVAALVIFLVGRALGPPVTKNKFDETPADVIGMDISDRVPSAISNEDIALIEKLGESIRSERKP